MQQNAFSSSEWIAPSGQSLDGKPVIWSGGPQERFRPTEGGKPRETRKDLRDTRELLYDLRHPQNKCWHSGKSVPPFFNNCPYCGIELRESTPRGVWLPPFGWSPFCGINADDVYFPTSLKYNEIKELQEPGGSGPLRFWIAPISGKGFDAPANLYAYRPKTGMIFYMQEISQGPGFKECQCQGETDALRGDPVGSARSWAPVWASDHLVMSTRNGLLALRIHAPGQISVHKIMDLPCLASPAVGVDGNVYVLASADGMVKLFQLDGQTLQEGKTCDWIDGGAPPVPQETALVSAPSGLPGGDVHWVFCEGMVILERDQGRWVAATQGVKLEPRIPPILDSAKIEVYGWHKDSQLSRYSAERMGSGQTEDAQVDVFPFPSGCPDRNQWFSNGEFVKFNSLYIGTSEYQDLKTWPLASWNRQVYEGSNRSAVIVATFDKMPLLRLLKKSNNDEAPIAELEIRWARPDGGCIGRKIRLSSRPKLRMPLDSIAIPISAETLILYLGDGSPRLWPISLEMDEPAYGQSV